MKFKKESRNTPAEYEKSLVKYWKKNKTFEKSVQQRPQKNSYVFYDGPPFITGAPHHGTLLSSVVKDAVPRYWTMKGKRVERTWGWDCHGLPAEVFTEEKLGIKDRRDIGTKISLETYITTCRDNMIQTGSEWEDTIDRVGRWVNFKGAYKTMDKEYMESVWWAFKQLYEKGKIYEGEKVLMYCPRDATPIAKAEVAMDNSYQDDTDPTAYVKFKLKGDDKYLLAWTTTPWTLLSNSAIAVNKDLEYVEVEVDGKVMILAEKLTKSVLKDEKNKPVEHKILKKFKGEELVGQEYEPLVDTYIDELTDNAFKIWHADFVHADEGTGIAHESPAYGEEDYELAKEHDIPWVLNTDENGLYTSGDWKGQQVWEVNKEIAKKLKQEGKVWKIEYITHPYPHCHRCDTKLIYRAHPSWFMDIDGQRTEMLEANEDINWVPEHLKEGRFKHTVESAPDWNLSRDRFWATPLPVWRGVDKEGRTRTKVVGSYDELEKLSGKKLDDYHRPWVDEITFEEDGVKYERIDKVMDCWFESGSMPFAQFHYPFKNKEKFEANFPGDFIVEYIAQVRAWFYYMHAVSIGLFGKKAFSNVITTGTIAGNDGRKMSKSYGNYTDPNELMNQYSADALRFYFLSSPLLSGEDVSMNDKDVGDVFRKLNMVWNMYDFFTLYAEVDNWEWDGNYSDPLEDLDNVLDRWIVSRVHVLGESIDEYMQEYDIPSATSLILPFIDDASNWYVRRSRRRFWKSDKTKDKNDAYRTLHYVLVRLSHILAPFTPFIAEELFIKLTGEESVHLREWPAPGGVDTDVVEQTKLAREIITKALSERSKAGIKLRQPLNKLSIPLDKEELPDEFIDVVQEEVNVKGVEFGSELSLDTRLTPSLKYEGMARDVIRRVQNFRKKSGLNVDDRIKLSLVAEGELAKAIEEHHEIIASETLASKLSQDEYKHTTEEKIDGQVLKISLEKLKI